LNQSDALKKGGQAVWHVKVRYRSSGVVFALSN